MLLDIIIAEFQRGSTAEQIAQDYSSVPLADVYQVIAYYLRHKEAVDAYMAARDREAEELKRRFKPSFPRTQCASGC